MFEGRISPTATASTCHSKLSARPRRARGVLVHSTILSEAVKAVALPVPALWHPHDSWRGREIGMERCERGGMAEDRLATARVRGSARWCGASSEARGMAEAG
eukprot:scaffold1383_cov360-Prasinococcus_capsulatus_cf.AAC.5